MFRFHIEPIRYIEIVNSKMTQKCVSAVSGFFLGELIITNIAHTGQGKCRIVRTGTNLIIAFKQIQKLKFVSENVESFTYEYDSKDECVQ